MDELEQRGHEAIANEVAKLEPPIVVVEMLRQLGDVLHSSIVVRQIRAGHPTIKIVWAISEAYGQTFEAFTPSELGPHAIALLPNPPAYPADGSYRIRWVEQAKSLPGVIRSFGCGVHPWGWKCGSIVDAILDNSGIKDLLVPRRPWLPITAEDHAFADAFIAEHGLQRFITMEYGSYSLKVRDLGWYADVVKRCGLPVIGLAGRDFAALPGAIDGRMTTFRQAKALIARSSCFVGCCSGLSVIAASQGCDQPVVEVGPVELSMVGIGYRAHGVNHVVCQGKSSTETAAAVRRLAR